MYKVLMVVSAILFFSCDYIRILIATLIFWEYNQSKEDKQKKGTEYFKGQLFTVMKSKQLNV